VVDVMLKPEILDPQGQAVANALPGLGIEGVAAVRIGKHIEIEFDDGVVPAAPADGDRAAGDLAATERNLELARAIADRLLANPVIEEFTVRAAGEFEDARL
jgi:phosphoribosylformylglycinamidine synthase